MKNILLYILSIIVILYIIAYITIAQYYGLKFAFDQNNSEVMIEVLNSTQLIAGACLLAIVGGIIKLCTNIYSMSKKTKIAMMDGKITDVEYSHIVENED